MTKTEGSGETFKLLELAAAELDGLTSGELKSKVLADLQNVGDRYRINKATKRYWKSWYRSLVVRDFSFEQFKNGECGVLQQLTDSVHDMFDADDNQNECATDDCRGEWQEVNKQVAAELERHSEILQKLKERQSFAIELLEERKRAEAHTGITRDLNEISTGRTSKQRQRLEIQQEEEHLRRHLSEIVHEKIPAAKSSYTEAATKSKLESRNSLRKKICFEEAAEQLHLVIEDMQLSGDWQQDGDNETDNNNINNDKDNNHESRGTDGQSSAVLQDELTSGGVRWMGGNGLFTCRAANFLKSAEEELQRQKDVKEIATERLESELDGLKGICFVRRAIAIRTGTENIVPTTVERWLKDNASEMPPPYLIDLNSDELYKPLSAEKFSSEADGQRVKRSFLFFPAVCQAGWSSSEPQVSRSARGRFLIMDEVQLPVDVVDDRIESSCESIASTCNSVGLKLVLNEWEALKHDTAGSKDETFQQEIIDKCITNLLSLNSTEKGKTDKTSSVMFWQPDEVNLANLDALGNIVETTSADCVRGYNNCCGNKDYDDGDSDYDEEDVVPQINGLCWI